MKSSYEIKKEMERKFGKEFIKKVNSQKTEFEELSKQLEEAESVEEKINDKANELRKNFIYIGDDYTIYPDEICSNYLRQFARKCLEENLSKKEIEEAHKEYEFMVIESLQEDINRLQEDINNCKKAWE